MSPYHNINGIIESIQYRLKEEPISDLDDIMHEIVDTEVSYNTWKLNKHIIEDYFNSDVVDAIIAYENEYGEIGQIKTKEDKCNLYARLAYLYIINEVREKWDEHLEEINNSD